MGYIRDCISRLGKVKTSKLQILRRDFESLSMKDSESVDSFCTRVFGLINQLKYDGETITDQRVVEKILISLPPRFENLVVTLEEHTEMTTFNIDELQDSLINHEHMLIKTQTSLEVAFTAQSSISRGRCRGETTPEVEEERWKRSVLHTTIYA